MKRYLVIFLLSLSCLGLRAQTWTKIGNIPIKGRQGALVLTYKNKAYIFGGQTAGGSSGGNYTDSCWIYDPASNTFTALPVFPAGHRKNPSGFIINDTAYVGLGSDDSPSYVPRKEFYAFDFNTKKWIKKNDFPSPGRYACISFSIGRFGFVATGSTGGSPYSDSAFKYNPKLDKWDTIAVVPNGYVEGAFGIGYNGKGYIAGGYSKPGDTREFMSYDTTSKKWKSVSMFKDSAYDGSIIFPFCNKLYFVPSGASDTFGSGYHAANPVFAFNVVTNALQKISHFPSKARAGAVGFQINGYGYMMSGWDKSSTFYTDLWKFTPPYDTIYTSTSSTCSGDSITLTAKGSSTLYYWSTGKNTQSIKVANSGKYWVTSGAKYCSIDSFNITIKPSPVKALRDSSLCARQPLTLDAKNAGSTYLWSTTDTSRTISPTTSGKYKVTITLNGCKFKDSSQVTFKPLPTKALHDTSVCTGQSLTLDAKNTGATYVWSTSATSEKISPTTSGKYKVTITLGGCSITDSAQVTFKALPSKALHDTTLCAGLPLTLDAKNIGATYAWSTSATSEKISPTTSGKYKVTITLSGCSIKDSSQVTFKPLPVKALRDTSVCSGQPLTLNAKNTGATYTWSTSATSQTISPATSGKYKVTITLSGCSIKDSSQVTINALPKKPLHDTTMCNCQDYITLSAYNAGATYLWGTGDTTTKLNIWGAGKYIVKITLHGCSVNDTSVVSVKGKSPTWSKVGTTKIKARQGAVGLTYNNKEYIFCGSLGSGTYTDSVWVFDPAKNTFNALKNYPGGHRYLATGFVIGDKGYVGLGQDDGSYSANKDFYVYYFAKDSWATIATFPGNARYDAGAFAIGQKGYVVCGSSGSAPYLTDAYKYNATSNTWTTLSSLPGSGKSGPKGYAYNGKGYVFGGYVNPGGSTDIIEYDTSTSKWTKVSHFADSAHANQRIFQVCGKTYLTTGYIYDTLGSGKGGGKSDYIYDFTTNKAIKQAPFPGNGRDHAIAFNANGNGYVMFGWNPGSTIYNDVWKFSMLTAASSDTVFKFDTSLCRGSAISLKANRSNLKYQWSTGDTIQKISVSDSGKYLVNIRNTFTCSNVLDSFNVKAKVSPVKALRDTSLCSGQPLTLSAKNTGATYAWSTSATTQTISPTSSGKYKVTITLNTCSLKDSSQVTFKANPVKALRDTTLCSGLALTLDAKNVGATYAWSTSAITEKISPTTSGKYKVTITLSGCSIKDSSQVTFNPTPVKALHDTSLCSGQSLTLNAKNSGATYAWSTSATTQTISPTSSGKYKVTISLSSCSIKDSAQVTFKANPVKALRDTTLCSGLPLTLDAKNVGATYAWSTSAITEKISPTTSGKYKVTITLSGCSIKDSSQVTFNPTPVKALHDTSLCSGQPLTLNAKNSGATYAWSTSATTQTISPTSSGKYKVTISLSSCSIKDSAQVTFKTNPVKALRDTTLCSGLALTLDAKNVGATYAWSTSAITEKISPTTSGKYKVTITLSGCSIRDSSQVTFNPTPVKALHDTSLCSGQPLTLNAKNSGATYAWSTSATTQTISPTSSGKYKVTISLSSCSIKDSAQVTFKANPVKALRDTILCSGLALTLDAKNVGATYTWSTSATTEKISPTTSGKYKVTITLSGCSIKDSSQVTFNPTPVKALHDTSLCSGQPLTLNAKNSGATYAWSTSATSQTISPTTSGKYKVTISLSSCSIKDSAQVTFKANPVKALRDTTLCSGLALTLDAKNVGATYAWSTSAITEKISPTTSGKYKVTITLSGCSIKDSSQVTFNPTPVKALHDTSLCSGQPLTLNAKNSGATYAWSTSATTQTISPTSSGKYKVTISLGACSINDSSQVTFKPNPVVNLGHDTAFCAGNSLVLKAYNAGATYKWSTTDTSNKITVSTSGSYSVKVNLNGCFVNDTIHITVKPMPVKALHDTSLCSGQPLTLNAKNSGATYAWSTSAITQTITPVTSNKYKVSITLNGCSINDSSQVTFKPNPIVNLGHDTTFCSGNTLQLKAYYAGSVYKWSTGDTSSKINVTTTGKYSVKLNLNGCYAFDTIKVTVNPTPVKALRDSALCIGQPLTLNANNPGASYAWNTSAISQTINPTTSGTYKVTISLGSCSFKDSANITFKPNPVAKLGNDTAFCAGNTLVLKAFNAGATYKWNTTDTTNKITVNTTGSYSVNVNLNGCFAKDTISVTVKPMPVKTLHDTSLCNGQPLVLSAKNTGATYAWNTSATTQSILPTTSGKYKVVITLNACSISDSASVTFKPNPTVNLGNDTTFCSGNTLLLKAYNSGATYKWSTTDTTSKITVSATGKYIVKVNLNGCYTSDTINIIVNTSPVKALHDTSLCAGQPLTLNAKNTGATYSWSTSATSQTISPTTSNKYLVLITQNGCSIKDSSTVTFKPNPVVNLGNDTTFCSGNTLLLKAYNSGATYNWSTTDTTSKITVSTTGKYIVKVNLNGCYTSDTINITVNTSPVKALRDTSLCAGQPLTLDAKNVGATYSWSTSAITQTISPGTSNKYSVVITLNGCTLKDSAQVTFRPLPVKALHDTSLCTGQPLTLDAGNAGASYSWSTGASTETISVSVSKTYKVISTINACSLLDSSVVYFKPLPVKVLRDTSVCQGSIVNISAGNIGARYIWNTGDTTQTILCTNTKEYKVTLNLNGCAGQDSAMVTFRPNPVVTLGNDTAFCLGNHLILNAGNTGARYKWNTGDTTQQITVSKTNTYSVIVNNGGCLGYDSLKLTIKPPLAYLRDSVLCAGPNVTLDAGNTGATYTWSTSDNTETIQVNKTGTYKVVISLGSCTITDSAHITFNPYPVVNLGNDTAICAGVAFVLNAGNPGAQYNWSTGDTTQNVNVVTTNKYAVKVDLKGCNTYDTINVTVKPLPKQVLHDTSLCVGSPLILNAGNIGAKYSWSTTDTTQAISPNISGTYKVLVTINACSITDSSVVVFKPNPIVFLGNDTAFCAGNSLLLNAGNTGAHYTWSTGDTTKTIQVTITAKYSVIVNLNGCIRSDTIGIVVKPLPVHNLHDTDLCNGMPLVLDAGNTGAIYIWNTSAITQTISPTTSGMYIVGITINGCSINDTAQVLFKPVPKVNLGADDTICQGTILTLDAGYTGDRYTWNNGDTTQMITASTNTGKYTYWAIVNASGCYGSDTVNVTVLARPVNNLTPSGYLCPNDTLVLNAGNPGDKYLWNNGDTSRTIKIYTPGAYWVRVNDLKCFMYDTITIADIKKPVVELGNNIAICYYNASTTLKAGFSPAEYLWSNGDTTENITIHGTGLYSVSVKNQCGIASDSVLIEIDNNCCPVELPTAFTPAHSNNNKFRVLSDCSFDEFDFRIYNRWGQLIFEGHDIKQFWDGTFRGEAQPEGVYVWYLVYRKPGAQEKTEKGDVTLIR